KMAYADRSPADKDRFICIYPAYLNNKKTIAEGRRIPMDKAVENPTATEIQDVCLAVGLNVHVEKNKMYSREWNRDLQYRGRVRVQLKQEDGSLCLVQFPSRKSAVSGAGGGRGCMPALRVWGPCCVFLTKPHDELPFESPSSREAKMIPALVSCLGIESSLVE
uniref:Signal recognition particle 19 kDa protein n=1 Tax=Monodelphis domestica TaxID=13616 RepID=A0A5F8HH79_MONDO